MDRREDGPPEPPCALRLGMTDPAPEEASSAQRPLRLEFDHRHAAVCWGSVVLHFEPPDKLGQLTASTSRNAHRRQRPCTARIIRMGRPALVDKCEHQICSTLHPALDDLQRSGRLNEGGGPRTRTGYRPPAPKAGASAFFRHAPVQLLEAAQAGWDGQPAHWT